MKKNGAAGAAAGAKPKKRWTRVIALSLAGALVLGVGIWALIALTKQSEYAVVDASYGSVKYEVEPGEKYSPTANYTGLEVFGKLNWTFAQQDNWYSEMHGTVQTAVGPQDVQNYKQFRDGVLISEDITKSSLINLARQFCYAEDYNRVVWREADNKDRDKWNGVETVFPAVEPSGNMDITGYDEESFNASFKAQHGLPATELSVYVFEENTVREAEPAVDNGDGTYTIVYHMNPEKIETESGATEGATAYYGNQMVFTGGIDAPPDFDYITVGFTFNEDWETLSCSIEESYFASMKTIQTNCSSTSLTTYEYDTDKSYSTAYDDYFRTYVEGAATGQKEKELTAAECLASAFGGVLTGPVLFEADADLNGTEVSGVVYLDLGTDSLDDLSSLDLSAIDARAAFGSVKLWLSDGVVYLSVGDFKVSAAVSELTALVPAGASETVQPDLLSSLMDAPVAHDRAAGTASIRWGLSLDGVEIPVGFDFFTDGKNVTLDEVTADIGIMDLSLGAAIRFGDLADAPAPVAHTEEFARVSSYAPALLDLFSDRRVGADISYTYDADGTPLTVTGDLAVDFAGDPVLAGTVRLTYGEIDRTLSLSYEEGTVYLALGGVKLRLDAADTFASVAALLPADLTAALGSVGAAEFSPASLLDSILKLDLGGIVSVSEDGNELSLLVRSTQLLAAFGVDFGLGDLSVTADRAGTLTVSSEAYGVSVTLSKAESVARVSDPDSYADATDVVAKLPGLVANGAVSLEGELTLETGDLSVSFAVARAAVAWKDGVRVYLEGTVTVGEAAREVKLSLDGSSLTVVYGSLGVVVYDTEEELGALKGALSELAARAGALSGAAAGGEAVVSLAESLADFDWNSLNKLELLAPEGADGLARVAFGGLWAEIAKNAAQGGLVALSFGYRGETADLRGAFRVGTCDAVPELPAGDYLSGDGLVKVVSYLPAVIDVVADGSVHVGLGYDLPVKDGSLSLTGEFDVGFSSGLTLAGTLRAVCGGIDRTVAIAYEDDEVYLTLEGVKVRLAARETLDALSMLLPAEAADALGSLGEKLPVGELVEKVLAFDLEGFVSRLAGKAQLTEADGKLSFTVGTADLFAALGVQADDLGALTLAVDRAGAVSANLGDLSLTVRQGSAPAPVEAPETYAELADVVAKLPALLENGAVTLTGTLSLTVGETEVSFAIREGAVAWKGGLRVYLDGTLRIGGSEHDIILSYTEESLALVYGTAGVRVYDTKEELGALEAAFAALAEKAASVAELARGGASEPAEVAEEAAGGAVAAKLGEKLAELFGGFGADTLGEIAFLAPQDGGFARIVWGALWAEIAKDPAEGGLVALTAGYAGDGFSLGGELFAGVCDAFPQLPEGDYLTSGNLVELLGFAGAAVDAAASRSINLGVAATVLSDDDKYAAYGGVKTEVSGSLRIDTGDGFPVTIETTEGGTTVRVRTDLYLNLQLAVVATHPDDASLWLDVTAADADADDMLDFFVTVSRFGEDSGRHAPLTFRIPAGDVMKIVSGAVALLGVDVGFVNDLVVFRWLDRIDTVPQLCALGDSLRSMIAELLPGVDLDAVVGTVNDAASSLSGLLSTLGGLFGKEEAPAALSMEGRKGFVKAVDRTVEEGGTIRYTVTLEGGVTVALELAETEGEEGPERALSVILGGIPSGSDTIGSLSLTLDTAPVTVPETLGYATTYDFGGIADLILALARSTTHRTDVGTDEVISGEETPHEYTLNRYFYIEGTISASILGDLVKVDIEIVGISVTIDEEGKVAVNVRLSYQGVREVVVAINGDTDVDLTIKDGMVYIKRTQKTYWALTEKTYDRPVVLYRAMPVSNFMNGILGQLGFILNFGKLIDDNIPKDGTATTPQAPAETEPQDFGALVASYITSYACTKRDSGFSWTVVVDGDAFSGGILDSMTVAIEADADGMVSKLSIPACTVKIPVTDSFNLTLSASAVLDWKNPGDVMPEGTVDRTLEADLYRISRERMGAQIDRLDAEAGWEAQPYLEAEEFTVTYEMRALAGGVSTVGSQTVFVSTGADGNAQYTLYGALAYPAFAEGAEFGYTWQTYSVGDVLPKDGVVTATQYRMVYSVTVYADAMIDESWQYDERGDRWFRVYDLEYGKTLSFVAGGESFETPYTVKGNDELTLPARKPYPADGQVGSRWTAQETDAGVVFTVLYDLNTVTYLSDVGFEAGGVGYNRYSVQFADDVPELLAPTAAGYTFLGWFERTESGLVRFTQEMLEARLASTEGLLSLDLEALWAEDGFLSFTASRDSKWLFGTYYTYSADAALHGDALVGAEGAVSGYTAQYAFAYGDGAFGEASSNAHAELKNSQTSYGSMRVRATVTVTFADGTSTVYTAEREYRF